MICDSPMRPFWGRLLLLPLALAPAAAEPPLRVPSDALFQPGQWAEYIHVAEQLLESTPPGRKTWHTASRLALAVKLAKDRRSPTAIADANFADAPKAKAVFLGVTELLDGDTQNVAALAQTLRDSRASLSQISQWLSDNGFGLGAASLRLIPAFYLTMPPADKTVWDAVKAYPEIPPEKREPFFAILKRYANATRPEQQYNLPGLQVSVERLYRQDPKWEYLDFVVQCARHLPPAMAKVDVSFVDTALTCRQPEHAVRLAAALVDLDPTSTEAKAKHAECLRRTGRPDEGLAVRREAEATAAAGERREARLDLLRAMTPEQREQEIAARQQAVDADPANEQARLALADAQFMQRRRHKDWYADPQLRREAAGPYESLLDTAKDAQLRRDTWSGLAECDPAQALQTGLPIAEHVLATYDPAAPVASGRSPDAHMFAKEVADALWSALRELNTAAVAGDKAASAVALCRQAAGLLALCSAKSPKLHASVRMSLTAAHALSDDYDRAVGVYAQNLASDLQLRREAEHEINDLFAKLSLTPGGGRLDALPTREAQWKAGLYFLEHLNAEPQSAQRTAENVGTGKGGNAEAQKDRSAEERAKVRAEILGIWAEFLTRTLRAVHGTTYTAAANRAPEPVDPKAVAEFGRIVTKRMQGAEGKGFGWKVKQNVQLGMFNEPSVVEMLKRVVAKAEKVTG